MNPLGYVISVAWTNPYTQPPDGKARVQAEVFIPYDQFNGLHLPDIIHETIQKLGGLGCGFGVSVQAISKAPRKLSQEKLAKIRRQRLERRIAAKYPLFAQEFMDQELNRKSDYYQGITDPQIEAARQKVMDDEMELRKRLGIGD